MLAAQNGKHVFVDKPIANTLADGKKMVKACQDAGVVLFTLLQLIDKSKDKPEAVPLSIGDPILEESDEFADCIRTGKKPETDGQGALVALALIRAAIDSARTGKPVDLRV